ncbi:MAG: GIY-YIG nuclease family protein [Sphingobacteriales bacterium]|jgi:putative endonuclease|nr:GIY-YIG nuclease family protein [Sphingobacteriales bacterium]
MFWLYILFSEKCKKFYVGYSVDVDARLLRHNSGMVNATKNCRPYIFKAKKTFPSQKEAMQEESRIKNKKSSKYIQWLIEGNW